MILPPICSISLAMDIRQAASAHNPVNRSEQRGVYASLHSPACVEANDDVLSALVNLCYQPPAAEKAIENAIAKDKALAGAFDGLFRGASKVIR